jgi:hypothetical protein
MALGLTELLIEIRTRNIGPGWGRLMRLVCGADNLTTFMCQMSGYLGALTSWNPQGLSRPVMGLLYVLLVASLCTQSDTMWPSSVEMFHRFIKTKHTHTKDDWKEPMQHTSIISRWEFSTLFRNFVNRCQARMSFRTSFAEPVLTCCKLYDTDC